MSFTGRFLSKENASRRAESKYRIGSNNPIYLIKRLGVYIPFRGWRSYGTGEIQDSTRTRKGPRTVYSQETVAARFDRFVWAEDRDPDREGLPLPQGVL